MDTEQNYENALNKLYSLMSPTADAAQWRDKRRTDKEANLTEEIRSYLRRVGVDLNYFAGNTVHIAGTKGKGSTCAFTESIIRHHGFTTGMFTSPHLICARERIRINGKPISEELFAKYFWFCYNKIIETTTPEEPWVPTFFKFVTLLAFKVFQEEKVQATILEVGIGGRADATNCLDSLVCCGITTLDYDHMAILGDTLGEIAFEKSGIMKAGVPCVTVPQLDEPQKVVISEANRKRAPLFVASPWQSYLQTLHPSTKNILGLNGDFQEVNASIAAGLAYIWLQRKAGNPLPLHPPESPQSFPIFPLTPKFVEGLQNCQWPGRAQRLSGFKDASNIHFYIDGAHTPASFHSCFQWFTKLQPPDQNSIFVLAFNCKTSKDASTLLGIVSEYTSKYPFHHILFTAPNVVGSKYKNQTDCGTADQENYQKIFIAKRSKEEENTETGVMPSINQALQTIYDIAKKNPTRDVRVLVTGSLYLVGGFLEGLDFKFE